MSEAMVSLLDIVPTALDWLNIPYPKYSIFDKNNVKLTGKSLLPILQSEPSKGWDTVYASHNLHEVTMYYPMRVLRNKRYKLIHNMNHKMPFPIDQDFFISASFQDLLNRTVKKEPLYWYKTLQEYYYRDQWELYDIIKDPKETTNLAPRNEYGNIFQSLKQQLHVWQNETFDPWICGPGAVLEDGGYYKDNPQCMPMHNGVN